MAKRNQHGGRFHAVAADDAVDWDHPLNRGRVAWWLTPSGIAAAGSRLLNLCDSRTSGTLNGTIAWQGQDRFGSVLTGFAGGEPTTTYVDCGNSPILNPVGGSTYAAWYYPTSLPAAATVLGRDDNTLGRSYEIYLNSSGDAALQINGAATATTSSSTTPTGFWSLLLARGDPGTNWEISVWRGDLRRWMTAGTGTWVAPPVSTSTTCIGRRTFSGSNIGASGNLGDVSIWNRRLSDAEKNTLPLLSIQGYRAPDSPLRWVSTRTYSTGVAQIAFDAASNSAYQGAASTYSWSHTCTGTNLFLSVDVSLLSAGATVTSITYNGVALSLIGAQTTVTSFGRVECWGLVAPASGTNTIAVTLSSSIASAGCAVSYANVNQSAPTEAFNGSQATNVGAADATVTVTPIASNTWVHGAIACNDGGIIANQTSRNNVPNAVPAVSGADEDTGPIASPTPTAVSYTSVGAAVTWAMGGYAIRPLDAGSGDTLFSQCWF